MMLQIDYRIGGRPRYYAAWEGDNLMQIPDQVRKCVAFVCYRDSNANMQLAGTAFFIAVARENLNFGYVVTAKHVLVGVQRNSIDQKVFLRVNMISGPSQFVETRVIDWLYHPDDSSVDAAILPLGLRQDIVDYLPLPIEMAVTDEVIVKEAVGVGDDVFLTGLFVNHYGNNKNLPIVRVGNIALMPEDRVQTRDFGAMDAYLVEARSIGGLSGSPVFLFLGSGRLIGNMMNMMPGNRFFWLGLMHGHWDIENQAGDNLSEDAINRERVNMGIAIVVPALKILEMVNQEALVKQREEVIKQQREQTLPTADSTLPELTREGFEDALKKVSRRIKTSEPGPEKSET